MKFGAVSDQSSVKLVYCLCERQPKLWVLGGILSQVLSLRIQMFNES